MGPFVDGYEPEHWQKTLFSKRRNRAAQIKQRYYARAAEKLMRSMINGTSGSLSCALQDIKRGFIGHKSTTWENMGNTMLRMYKNTSDNGWDSSTYPEPAKALLAKTFQSKSTLTSRKAYMLCKRLTAILLEHADKQLEEEASNPSN